MLATEMPSVKREKKAHKGGKNGGRKKGSTNKSYYAQNYTLSQLIQEHTLDILGWLLQVAEKGESESARVAACSELLDRGYGKPRQTHDLYGKIEHVHIDAREEIRSAIARIAARNDAGGDLRLLEQRITSSPEVAVEVLGEKRSTAAT